LGIKEIRVLDQEGGGGAPARTELKRERRIGIRSSAKVWYHSYWQAIRSLERGVAEADVEQQTVLQQ
jgi:hypothetical protein